MVEKYLNPLRSLVKKEATKILRDVGFPPELINLVGIYNEKSLYEDNISCSTYIKREILRTLKDIGLPSELRIIIEKYSRQRYTAEWHYSCQDINVLEKLKQAKLKYKDSYDRDENWIRYTIMYDFLDTRNPRPMKGDIINFSCPANNPVYFWSTEYEKKFCICGRYFYEEEEYVVNMLQLIRPYHPPNLRTKKYNTINTFVNNSLEYPFDYWNNIKFDFPVDDNKLQYDFSPFLNQILKNTNYGFDNYLNKYVTFTTFIYESETYKIIYCHPGCHLYEDNKDPSKIEHFLSECYIDMFKNDLKHTIKACIGPKPRYRYRYKHDSSFEGEFYIAYKNFINPTYIYLNSYYGEIDPDAYEGNVGKYRYDYMKSNGHIKN